MLTMQFKTVVAEDYLRIPFEQRQAFYSELVELLIHLKYSQGAENAILRQRDTKPEEFAEYYAYAEECKIVAKQILSQPDED